MKDGDNYGGEQKFNVLSPFVIDFDIHSGLSDSKESSRRYLSDMKNMYFDDEAYHQLVKEGDPLVYEFYELDIPRTPGDIAFGTTVIYPGKVGREYFMTKGHFHEILDTAEIYYCLSGRGYLLMENTEGDWTACELAPGKAVYVPAGYAHRSINTGSEPLLCFLHSGLMQGMITELLRKRLQKACSGGRRKSCRY